MITLMLLITVITLITQMKVFQHTGPRHMNLILHRQVLLYSTYSEAGDLLTEKEDIQNAQDHQVDYADSVINRNQRNQSDLQHSQATLRVEQSESDSALHANDSSPGKARASPFAQTRSVVPIIHMHDGSALIHPVRPGATKWTAGIATGS